MWIVYYADATIGAPVIDLPENLDNDSFDAWRSKRHLWEGPARRIARSAGLTGNDITPFNDSTNLVLEVDGRAILKIFPPNYHDQFERESAALYHLDGRLSVLTPRIISAGDENGWSWLVMPKLQGVVGSAIWPQLSLIEKGRILRDVGRIIAEVHSVPSENLADIDIPWPDFIRSQAKGCVERHRKQGLAERFWGDLNRLANEAIDLIPLDEPHVILTGDWIPQNFLLSNQTGEWRIAALIDFGDVRTGWREYDLLAPSALMWEGNALLVRSLFQGFGADLTAGGDTMRRRLLALMALHQYSDFRSMEIPDWEARASSLFDLQHLIWPCD